MLPVSSMCLVANSKFADKFADKFAEPKKKYLLQNWFSILINAHVVYDCVRHNNNNNTNANNTKWREKKISTSCIRNDKMSLLFVKRERKSDWLYVNVYLSNNRPEISWTNTRSDKQQYLQVAGVFHSICIFALMSRLDFCCCYSFSLSVLLPTNPILRVYVFVFSAISVFKLIYVDFLNVSDVW